MQKWQAEKSNPAVEYQMKLESRLHISIKLTLKGSFQTMGF